MPSRRHVLTFLAAAPFAGAVACAPGSGIDAAAAWRSPGAGEVDVRRFALAHAILAPNPHNLQPWLIALEGDDAISLWPDLERLLPATDPHSRQIVIGCGSFLELLDLAAREKGYRADIQMWPDGEPGDALDGRRFAHVRLVRDAAVARDPLFGAIVRRRTNREPYDTQRVPEVRDLEATIAGASGLEAGFTVTGDQVAALRDLVWRGWLREQVTPAALKESVDVMQIGGAEIARHRDGIVLDGMFIDIMKGMGLLSRAALLDPNSFASQQGAQIWHKMAETAPAFVWLKGADNSRTTQILAGRAYVRMNLTATSLGLAMHPWSMALQEYPEMAALYAEQQAMLGGTANAPVQMLARIGYARDVDPAPRRGLDEHLKE
jgi:hypothetical protein